MIQIYNLSNKSTYLKTTNLRKHSHKGCKIMNITPILVIDDEPINLKVVSIFLGECNFDNIHLVTSGKKAIDLFQKNNYSLILLDIGLPDMDGIEVCKAIRKLQGNKCVRIIAVTAYTNEIEEKCKLAGFDDVIHKPLNFNSFKELIEKWITLE